MNLAALKLPFIGHWPMRRQWLVLFPVLVLSLVIAWATVWIDSRRSVSMSVHTRLVGDALMHSQRLARNAPAASRGQSTALRQFSESREAISAALRFLRTGGTVDERSISPVSGALLTRLDEVEEAWRRTDRAALSLLAQKGVLSGVAVSLEVLASDLPALADRSEQVAQLLHAGASAAESLAAARLFANSERMAREVLQLAQPGASVAERAMALRSDAAAYGAALDALLGLIEARRSALPREVEIRTRLKQMQASFARLSAPLARLVESLPGLQAESQRQQAEALEREAKRANEQNQAAILRLMNELQEVADGDLTVQATVSEEITGAIADSVNYTIEELRALVAKVNATSGMVGQASQQAQTLSSPLLALTDRQAVEIKQTGAAILDLATRMREVSGRASEAAEVARESLDAASRGRQAVAKTMSGMDGIRDQIQSTAKRIKRLGESSQEIGEIVDLISDLSEQTHVLALNAAIQAASAGEEGRGFSAVAQEVQRLAERSARATRQITALIRGIQMDTQDAVAAMETSTQGVVSGTALSDAAGQALDQIGQVSSSLAVLIEGMAAVTGAEASTADDVAQGMGRILRYTDHARQGSHSAAASVQALGALANELQASVARFRVTS